jgi:hypothetical protein
MQKMLTIHYQATSKEKYHFPKKQSEQESVELSVKDGQKVRRNATLFTYLDAETGVTRVIKTKNAGVASVGKTSVSVESDEAHSKEYPLPSSKSRAMD